MRATSSWKASASAALCLTCRARRPTTFMNSTQAAYHTSPDSHPPHCSRKRSSDSRLDVSRAAETDWTFTSRDPWPAGALALALRSLRSF